ncbi:MAG: hypothetical protein ABR915_11045 [Thermoguttaceae bacterium]
MSAASEEPRRKPAGASAPAVVHVHISKRNLALLALLLIAPWLVVTFLWTGDRLGRRHPVEALPEGSQVVSEEVILGKPGPWGQLDYTPMTLSLPDEFVLVQPPDQPPVRWFFHGFSRDRAVEFLGAAGLSANEMEEIAQRGKWTTSPEGVALEPGDELILTLAPDVRAKIYQQLVEFPENQRQIDPIWFRPGHVEDRLTRSCLSAASLNLLKGLLYPQGPSLLLFADFEPALRQLPDDAERRRFIKAVQRKETLLVRLHVGPEADTDALANYWGVGGRHKDILPLLRAAQRVEKGVPMNILLLLPQFARDHLYNHPFTTAGLDRVNQDCFWSSFNFFQGDAPDDRFNDMAHVREVLQKDYYNIQGPSQLGDLVLLSTQGDTVIHAAVHLADDLVFTKNGESQTQPWLLMHQEDMIATYTVRHPLSGPLKPLYFRRKSL